MTPAFITNKNSPSVSRVIGNVKIIKIGLSVKLIKIITAANKNPVVQLSMLTPVNKKSAIKTEIPPKRILVSTVLALFFWSMRSKLEI